MTRKYSIEEMDEMRGYIERMYTMGVAYKPAERVADIEQRLRSFMANGTEPHELAKKAEEFAARDWADWRTPCACLACQQIRREGVYTFRCQVVDGRPRA